MSHTSAYAEVKCDCETANSGYKLIGTLANSEDPDEMLHKAVFCQGLPFSKLRYINTS